MKDGYIMQVGTPTEVFEMPKNLFVAEFIGAPMMNIIKTSLTREGGEYYVHPFGVKLHADGVKGDMLKAKDVPEGEIMLGVRPEHMVLANEGDEGAIPCRLEVNEMMGSELHLHVTTEDETRMIVRVPTVGLETRQREALVSGARLFVTFEGKVMHFFDPASEENLLND